MTELPDIDAVRHVAEAIRAAFLDAPGFTWERAEHAAYDGLKQWLSGRVAAGAGDPPTLSDERLASWMALQDALPVEHPIHVASGWRTMLTAVVEEDARLRAGDRPPAPSSEAIFFQRCWDRARDGQEIEGSDVQDWGYELGLLECVRATAACGPGCWCEEYYGEFPVDCYRPVEGGGAPTPAMIDGFRATEWKRTQDCTVNGWPSPTIGLMVSPFYDGERYAVRDGHGMCLNSAGEWEYEVQPSSRDDAFYERCRFPTFDAAVGALRSLLTAQTDQP